MPVHTVRPTIALKKYRCALDGAPTDLPLLKLPEQFRAVLGPTIDVFAQLLQISAATLKSAQPANDLRVYGSSRVLVAAEMFTNGRCTAVVTLRHGQTWANDQSTTTIGLTCIDRDPSSGSSEIFRNCVEDAVGKKLQPFVYLLPRFKELVDEGRAAATQPTDSELQGVEVLRDPAARVLLTSIKAAGGLLLRDLPRQLRPEDRGRADHLERVLRSAELVESEVVVTCTKTQTQTARVASRDALAQVALHGMKCACGKTISSERVEEALTVTDLGRSLLDRSRWLTIVVVNDLVEMGVPLDGLLIEQQLGGDEVDCLASIGTELVLFELKDKEFNLGSAYSLGAKIGIVRPTRAVIVSTEHVGGDAKEHFARARDAARKHSSQLPYATPQDETEIVYIEGLDDVRPAIARMLQEMFIRDVESLIGEVLPLSMPDASAVARLLVNERSA